MLVFYRHAICIQQCRCVLRFIWKKCTISGRIFRITYLNWIIYKSIKFGVILVDIVTLLYSNFVIWFKKKHFLPWTHRYANANFVRKGHFTEVMRTILIGQISKWRKYIYRNKHYGRPTSATIACSRIPEKLFVFHYLGAEMNHGGESESV